MAPLTIGLIAIAATSSAAGMAWGGHITMTSFCRAGIAMNKSSRPFRIVAGLKPVSGLRARGDSSTGWVAKLSGLAGLAMSGIACAGGSYAGTITFLEGTGGSNAAAVFVGINGSIGGQPPACAQGETARFVINPSTPQGQALVAMALSAQARGASVTIYGSGTCDIWGDTESVYYLVVN